MFIWFYHSLYIYKFGFCYKVKTLLPHLSISLYYIFMDSSFIQWFISHYVQCLVTQSYLTLCDPKDGSPPGSSVHGILQARILELPCLPPGDFPNPEIKPRSPTLQADSLPSEPPGKPKNAGVGNLSLLQGNFPTQESNWGLLNCRWILYQLSYQRSPLINCNPI